MKCPHTNSIGAHLLGALEPGESLELERHYRTCPHCRDELVRLAPLPGLLQHISPGDTEPPPVRAPLRSSRRTRRLRAAAAALALFAATAVGGYATGHATSGTPAAAAVSWSNTVDPAPGMRATAQLSAQPWGTEVRLHLTDPPPGQQCRLVVFTADGRQQTTGWWTTGYYTDADITTSTSLPLTELTRLEVQDTTGTSLAGITK
ncbi:MAG TPA: zf-HC2 domain-containing protein [Amycolatopsis sp.]|nr:zf-HC2 domain-containing protein [Amycolatopsis sp.]